MKITKEEIKKLMLENGLIVEDVIDCVIELNGIIGVGLITFGEQLENYVHSKIKRQ